MIINKKNSLILLAGAGIFAIIHAIGVPTWIEAFIITLLFLIGGRDIGSFLLPRTNLSLRTMWGFIATIAILMLIRGAWFYGGGVLIGWGETWCAIITIILSATATFILPEHQAENEASFEHETKETIVIGIVGVALSFCITGLIFFSALKGGTTDAIRTPWPLLPEWTLPLIACQWVIVLASSWRIRIPSLTAVQTMLAIFTTTCIAPLIYKIGYGFDGFLHVAGEKILFQTGTLNPKPTYYMGQYVFTTWLSRIGELNIDTVDRWLVPVASATLIPLSILAISKKKESLLFPSLILLPLGAFIATTPHGFSCVLGISSIILCIGLATKRVRAPLPILIALWTALTHPLIGIPVLGATIVVSLYGESRLRKILAIIGAILTGFSIPLVFGLASAIGSTGGVSFDLGLVFQIDTWKTIANSWIPWVQNRYAIWPETSVWVEKLLPLITILFALVARIRFLAKKESCPPWLTLSIATAAASLILQFAGDFGFLIDYERGNYAERLWLVSWIFLLPLALPQLTNMFESMKDASRLSLVGVILAVAMIGAGTSYASLPRHDAVTPSRGWSVGSADIEAVTLIDKNSDGKAYTVLANQSVSAAAVRTLGFKRYNDDVFFYPIPTGGDLYKVFLKASYGDPSTSTMREAGELGGSSLVYFVVNNYWWKSSELIEKARASADRVFDIQDGKVTVFQYEVK